MEKRKRKGFNKAEKDTHPEVELANQISIIDFAKKEGLEIVYEDDEIAKIPDITGDGEIIVRKKSNSWEFEENGKITHGNTIRFVARMDELEWPDAIDFLVQDRNEYLSYEEYNQAYESEHKTKAKEMPGRNIVSNNEVSNVISLVDYARSIGLDVKEVNDRIAIISSYPGLLINKKMNTWDYRVMNVSNGDIIRFISKFNQVEMDEAVILLEAYKKTLIKQNENQKEEKELSDTEQSVLSDETKNTEMRDQKKETGQIIKESSIEDIKNTQKQKTFSKEQLAEIIAGLKNNIDISVYNNPDLNPNQMRELRLGLQEGISMNEYNYPSVSAEYLKEIRLALQESLDISLLQLNERNKCVFQVDQAREIRLGLKNKLTLDQIKIYAKSNLDAASMKELRLGLQDGFDKMKELNNGHFTAENIHTIRINLIVKKIIESIQSHVRNLYENMLETFKNIIIDEKNAVNDKEMKQPNDGSVLDIQEKSGSKEQDNEFINEAKFQLKDVAEILYEAMEEKYIETGLSYEEKKEILINSIKGLIKTADNIEHITNVDKSTAMDQAVETFVEETEIKNLQMESLKSLQQEYVDRFYEQENLYNEKLAEFTKSIIDENNINYDQKVEIFYETLGVMYDKSVAENWIKHLYPKQEEIVHNEHKVIQKLNPEKLNKLYQNLELQIEEVEETEYELGQ